MLCDPEDRARKRGNDGQKEDAGQDDEEGRPEEAHQDCWCQAQDGRSRKEAAPAGSENIPSEARGPGGRRIDEIPGPPPRLVTVPLLYALVESRAPSGQDARCPPGVAAARRAPSAGARAAEPGCPGTGAPARGLPVLARASLLRPTTRPGGPVDLARRPGPAIVRCVVTEGRRAGRTRSERIPFLKALSSPP